MADAEELKINVASEVYVKRFKEKEEVEIPQVGEDNSHFFVLTVQ